MTNTLVVQSSPPRWRDTWVARCLDSVCRWARSSGYDYRLYGDELFDVLPPAYREKVAARGPILADLARLIVMEQALERYERVVWLDADVLIWWPEQLDLCGLDDARFGRECWVTSDARGRFKVHRSLHNAFCAFARGSEVLPFLRRCTQSVVLTADADHIAPQMVGPKLITALHSLAGFEVDVRVGALSVEVQSALVGGEGAALDRFLAETPQPLAAANLCASLATDFDRAPVVDVLLDGGLRVD